ncbi:MAG: lysylphosphatidylglycerol synthase transmembrane domain-containing protein [Gaiellaceae bacterium]
MERAAATADRAAWKRYGRPGVLLAVTGVSLYLLFPSLAAVFSSSRSLDRLTWYWAALALACEAGSLVLLWELNRIALHLRDWVVVACAQLSGNAVGKVVPGGGATATAFSVGMLRRAGVDAGNAATALTATAALQLGAVLALPLLALPAIIGGAAVDRSLATSAYRGAALLVLLVAAGVAAFASDRPLTFVGRWIEWLLNRTIRRNRRLTGLPEALLAQRDFVRRTIGPRWKAAIVSASASTMLDYAALLCALQAVGAQPRPSLVILAYTAGKLLALIPLTPGGLGFVEAGLVGTLTLAGVTAGDALLATLAYRLVSYWLPIPAGAIAYGAFRRRFA